MGLSATESRAVRVAFRHFTVLPCLALQCVRLVAIKTALTLREAERVH